MTVVSSLGGVFTTTGTGVALGPDGVVFGPYADGAAAGGALDYHALDRQQMSSVRNLALHARYLATGDTGGAGAPYVRIYVQDPDGREGRDPSWVFRPGTQPVDPDASEGPFHEWVPTSGYWQWDENSGSLGVPVAWSTLMSQPSEAGREITGIAIGVGRSQGSNLSALLRWWQLNGVTHAFQG